MSTRTNTSGSFETVRSAAILPPAPLHRNAGLKWCKRNEDGREVKICGFKTAGLFDVCSHQEQLFKFIHNQFQF